MTIGFIGLGNMGSAIAGRLMKGGQSLVVWNRSPAAAERVASEGARRAGTPAEALQGEVAFSMLADDAAIEATLVTSGALKAARQGMVHVNCATVSVALAERLEALHGELGLAYVAAPVLGRPDAAAAGQLHVLAAGQPDAVAKVRPLLDLVGQRVWPVGDHAPMANVVQPATLPASMGGPAGAECAGATAFRSTWDDAAGVSAASGPSGGIPSGASKTSLAWARTPG